MIDVVPAFDWRDWVEPAEVEPPPPPPPTPPTSFGVARPSGWALTDNSSAGEKASWPWTEVYSSDHVTINNVYTKRALLRSIVPTDYTTGTDFTLIAKMSRPAGGYMVGPMCVDHTTGDGVIASFYSSPNSFLTLRSTAWGYAGGFTQGPTPTNTPAGVHWIKLRKSGTSYYTSFSTDGISYSAETPPVVWAGVPTKIGFGCILTSAPITALLYEFSPGIPLPPEPEPEPEESGWVINDDLSSALKSFAVETGRNNANDKVPPTQATIVLGAKRAGACPQIGRRFRLALTDDLAAALGLDEDEAARFTGEITDPVMDPVEGTYTLTAVGRLGRARRRPVDVSAAPTEDDGNRVRRILVAAAPDADLDVDPGTADLFPPPEPAPAGQLLDLVVDSTLGQVVEQPDGVLAWHDADHRRGATPVLELPASAINNRIRWAQSVGDLLNEAAVNYGVSNASVLFRDPASIAEFEAYAQSITTALVDQAAAHSLGSLLVGRRSAPVWQLPALLVDLTTQRVSDELLALLLALRHADRIELTGLPSGSPYPATQEVYVEGVTEAAAYLGGGQYAWTRSIAVSDPQLSGVAVRVMDAPADLQIEDVEPTLTVLACARIEDPEELRA